MTTEDLDALIPPREQSAMIMRALALADVQHNAACGCLNHRIALDTAIVAARLYGATGREIMGAYKDGARERRR